MLSLFVTLFLIPLVSSLSRHKHIHRRQSVDLSPISGKFDSVSASPYSLLNNLWGEDNASGGHQSSQLVSLDGDTVAWETSWNWYGGSDSNVKTFANIQLDVGTNQQLSAISSMPSIWEWTSTYDNGGVMADVAYDLFTSYSPGGSNVNEIMIWLGNFNTGPISFVYDQYGHAVPIARNLSIGSHTWNLYSGNNGQNQVYSFLLNDDGVQVATSYSDDIYKFFVYLIDNEGINESQYLTTAQAGTEATTGSATLKTLAYSLSIN